MNLIRALLTVLAVVLGASGYTPAVEKPEPIRVQSEAPEPILVPVTLADLLPETSWPESEWATVEAVAWCESRWDPSAVGLLGEQGVLQVRPEFHGPVPSDVLGQLEQGYSIWSEYGWTPWSCRP